jgi:hypothetical protein
LHAAHAEREAEAARPLVDGKDTLQRRISTQDRKRTGVKLRVCAGKGLRGKVA